MKRSIKIASLLLMILLISVTFFACGTTKKWTKDDVTCFSVTIYKNGKVYSKSKTDFYNKCYKADYDKGTKCNTNVKLDDKKCEKFSEKSKDYGPDKWCGGGKKTVKVVYEYVYVYEYYGGKCKTVSYYDQCPKNYDKAGSDLKDLCGKEVLPKCCA